ncbi:hypothetical protein AB1Y20_012318 [Prymnesium parvum]|uniref:Peptidylamidoglycolate lyase n=1 Tax=Prymnesium parvum TaxID=97485 RepID=A0AB34IQA6_PRYPA
MVARTRSRRASSSLSDLPLQPELIAHLLSTLEAEHGTEALELVAPVCQSWCRGVRACLHIDPEPEHRFGELRSGDKPLRFDRPHGAVFLADGDVCVADCDNFRLQIVSRDGLHLRDVRLPGGTSCPTSVAVDAACFYVVEHGAHTLSKLQLTGHRLLTAGGWGGGPGQLRHPWGVALAAGRVYVTDGGNDRVCVFSAADLTHLFSFGRRGSAAGELRGPRGVAASATELFVADCLNHRVQVYELPGGAFRRTLGGGESAALGRFKQPSGVAVANGRLYVTELAGERLQVMGLDGLPMQAVALGAGPLSGVCVDEEYVCVTALDGQAAIHVLALRSFM